jgi:hypothetical protein
MHVLKTKIRQAGHLWLKWLSTVYFILFFAEPVKVEIILEIKVLMSLPFFSWLAAYLVFSGLTITLNAKDSNPSHW